MAAGRCAADLLGGVAAVTDLLQSWELKWWVFGLVHIRGHWVLRIEADEIGV